MDKVYIIVLNWNGWRDTIECLESLLHLDYENYAIVVCDNASSDESVEKIKRWASGEVIAQPAMSQLSRLILPASPKPIPILELTRAEAESACTPHGAQIVLIETGGNLGFAGGNNVGLRYALHDADARYFWLLNNDTVVEPGALRGLLHFVKLHPSVGLCGSLQLSYYNPAEVQVQGGKPYRWWSGRVATPPPRLVQELTLDPVRMDYVNGASMFARRAFLEAIGLMDESYFLYFEELDWAVRARGKFTLGYARESVIYHKEGATVGSHQRRERRSILSDQYLSRNRVLFTRRYRPWALPSVLLWACLAAAHRLLCGDPRRARVMVSSIFGGLTTAPHKARKR